MNDVVKSGFAAFLALLTLSSAMACDSYDPTTNQLMVPLGVIGTTDYTTTVITVGNVVALNGGSASSNYDSYDPATNRLTIPCVQVGGQTFTNVSITVGTVVSVGDSRSTTGPTASKMIASISVCKVGAGPSGSCPSGSVDSLQPILAPAAQGGGVINAYGGLLGVSDEHVTILPPGTFPAHTSDYLFLVASQTALSQGQGPGLVVLTGGAGPDANGQWTLDYAPDYGRYKPSNSAGSQNGEVFTSSVGLKNCPVVTDATLQDPTFDLIYAAPGSVVIDPTNPSNTGPGDLLMAYEGTNTCIGVTNQGDSGNFYSTVGIATSLDHGVTWPTYRANWVSLPGQSTRGPNAPLGALGNQVCMGNDCTSTPPAGYGRYAVLDRPVSAAAAIQAGQPLNHDMGNSALSAFVDDVNVATGTYLYVVSNYNTGPPDLGGFQFDSSAVTTGIAIARAQLNGGSAPLQFMKWYGPSVSYANGRASGSFAEVTPAALPQGVTCSAGTCPPFPNNKGLGSAGGGLDSPIFPTNPGGGQNSPSFKTCQGAAQSQGMPSISYVQDTHQYLLTFVCSSPVDPSSLSAGPGAAWFYSTLDATQYDLSRQDKWSAPQEIIGSWSPFDSNNPCGASGNFRSYSGWYPTFMSMNLKPGHLSISGYVAFLKGCAGGGGGRQFSSRTFTITTN